MPEHNLPDPPDWDWRKEHQEQGKARPEPKRRVPSEAEMNRSIGLGIAIGYSFVGPVLGFMLLGLLLDGWHPGGWTMVGLLVGMAAALVLLVRLIGRINRDG